MSVMIGNFQLAQGAVLAPMAGVTDAPFRLLCAEQGAALTVTEMISAKGVLCAPPGNRALRDLLYTLPGSGPTALQLFGSEPDVMAQAALRLLDSSAFCLIDLNMGCPAPKIVREGAGSALMREPALAARIVEAVARAAPVPVTVKMRLGWDAASRNGLAFALAMQEAGAAAVTVHGRTRDQFYAGEADWQAIAEIKAALRIPVLGNGDIATGAQVMERMAHTVDSVMIGRGAMGNPWVFADVNRALCGLPPVQAHWKERGATAARHLQLMVEWKGEGAAVPEMRKHIGWYIKGLPGAAKLRAAINRMESMQEMLDCLEEI